MRLWPKRRWWLVLDDWGKLQLHKSLLKPSSFLYGTLVDGPFSEQEDAVRSLAFWKAQRVQSYYEDYLDERRAR